jgi:hypothetical protein
MKTTLLTLIALIITLTAQAQIDLTDGGSGTTTYSQSFNETRAVDVTVLSSDVQVTAMSLAHLDIGGTAVRPVGLRIYEPLTGVLLASHDTMLPPCMDGGVKLTVSFLLRSGHTYRLGFHCGDASSFCSGAGYRPSFPYTEHKGILRIDSAYATTPDTCPRNFNLMVPFITIFYVTPAKVSDGLSRSNLFQLSPNPAHSKVHITLPERTAEVAAIIMDLQGRLAITSRYKEASTLDIDISKLPEGEYFIKLVTQTHTEVLRFVKAQI